MCSCQAYGKSGVPNARGFCLVCGELVEPVITVEHDVEHDAGCDSFFGNPCSCTGKPPCPEYRPDHNGECLNCDEPADAHRVEQLTAEYTRILWDEMVRHYEALTGVYDPFYCEAAKRACHACGLPWTDPRTGVTYLPPEMPPER